MYTAFKFIQVHVFFITNQWQDYSVYSNIIIHSLCLPLELSTRSQNHLKLFHKMAIFLVFAILIASFLNQVNTKSVSFDTRSVSNVAVIGAGASGLVSTKHLAAKGFNVRVYEQTDHIGGIWRYTEETGKDRYGLDINSPMYQGLRYVVIEFHH